MAHPKQQTETPITVLHIDASARSAGSVTRGLSARIVDQLTARHGDVKVIRRDLAGGVPFITEAFTAAINTPEDFAGIKFRVPKSAIMVDTYQALGANPTAIDWGDLYAALQQGVADGLEGPPQNMIDAKFYEFLDHYSYIDPFFGVVIMIMNDGIYESLTDEEKAVIEKAGKEAGAYQRWVSAKSHVDGMARLADHGVEVNTVADRQPFVDAVGPIWEKYKPEIGPELVDKVLAAGQ